MFILKVVKILNKVLLIIVILTASVFVLGISYAFFTSGFSSSETAQSVTITSGDITVVFDGGNEIEALNVEPSIEPLDTKTFTVTCNNTFENKETWYELTLVVDENNFSTNEYHTLYKVLITLEMEN